MKTLFIDCGAQLEKVFRKVHRADDPPVTVNARPQIQASDGSFGVRTNQFGFTINGNTINSIVGVPLMTVIVLFASLGVILALKKVPILKKLVG